MNLKIQKYLVALFLFIVNLIFSTTSLIYENDWYAFIFVLGMASLINTFSVLFIVGHKLITKDIEVNRIESKNYIYVIPCYNESEDELTKSLNSLVLQRNVKNDKRSILIICDGIATGKNNSISTDKIIKKLLCINSNEIGEYYDYKTWDNERNIIKIFTGVYNHLNEMIEFILIIKNTNYGKRDSLVLARKLCYNYNSHNTNDTIIRNGFSISENLFKYIFNLFKMIYGNNLDYIIGIDADTIFDYNCSYELIQSIEKDKNIYGCVGYVDILMPNINKLSKYSPFILYQYGEYMFSQCLRRYTQSTITKKVNCLSGCNQILRVSNETCGNEILNVLNYLPSTTENIFNHIRSYASEDRNHVCHMLSMYPYVKSTQTLKAIAYTSVPTSVDVFMSQRRRWNLGAMTNDMLLLYLPDINIFERISAFINVMTFSLTPFIFIATIAFIKAVIEHHTMLMLYLSTIIFIPLIYAFLIPIFIRPLSFRDSLYYYGSYLFFILFGFLVKLISFGYSLTYMDLMTWGKTRENEINDDTIEMIEINDDTIEMIEINDDKIEIIEINKEDKIENNNEIILKINEVESNTLVDESYIYVDYITEHIYGTINENIIIVDNKV
jgi:chitin synthase